MLTDFHSHILPGIDDGSKSLQESMQMLRMEARQGTLRVVGTPHFYPQRDNPERFLKRRAEAENLLLAEMAKEQGLPELSECEALSQLTIGGKGYILIEMPHVQWTDRMYRELEDIRVKQGLTPIVAHIDRYIRPFRTYGIPECLQELPVLVQANASFFLQVSTARMALRLLREDKIHLLGSDCHNLVNRPPNLGEAAEKIMDRLGSEVISRIKLYENEVWFR